MMFLERRQEQGMHIEWQVEMRCSKLESMRYFPVRRMPAGNFDAHIKS